MLNNNGFISGQRVFHYHVHLLPRFSSDEIKIILPDNINKMKENDYQTIVKSIRMNLEK